MKNKLLSIIENDPRMELIVCDGWLYDDSTGIMFKVNNHNVYRTILFPDHMCFQCVKEALVLTDGREMYDDSRDYRMVYTESYKPMITDPYDFIDNNTDKWPEYFLQWVNECENSDANYTEYEYE